MRAPIAALIALSIAACDGASPASGQGAMLHIKGAQYVARAIDTSAGSPDPEVHTITTANNTLYPGVANKALSGAVGPGSASVLVGVQGDVGHWIVPVQDFDQNRPGDFYFACSLSFGGEMPPGDYSLVLRAAGVDGRVGPPWVQPVTMAAPRLAGSLVLQLSWDTQADLDLHLTIPGADGGVDEIYARKPSGLPRGTPGATVADGLASGYLVNDSNAQCVLDGRREESIVFPGTVPAGTYTARVDTFSLCGEDTARWSLRVFRDDVEAVDLARFGQSTAADTRAPHGQGAGVRALVFNIQ